MTVLSRKSKKNHRYKLKPWVYMAIAIIILVVCFIIVINNKEPIVEKYNQIVYTKEYEDLVEKYSEEYGVDKNLIYAVIKTESGFNPEAISEVGARGLMQLTEETFDWVSMKMGITGQYKFEDLHEPELGIKYGTYLLSYLIDEFNTYQEVLSAYHAGRGIVNTWLDNQNYSQDGKTLDVIPYSDTAHYVDKVMTAYEGYCQMDTDKNTKEK